LVAFAFFAIADEPPRPLVTKQAPAAEQAVPVLQDSKRTDLNLQGQTDTSSGESRRNENIQFDPIDNNALKELNVRLGTTATIVREFAVDRNYFGAEFGKAVSATLHVPASRHSGIHGKLHESHNNSMFSARSFFQVGGVKPARTNDYGFQFGTPLWSGAFISLDGNQEKIRGSVNGNVLVPRADERTPLTTDLALRRMVERFLAAYPAELPNRTDINERALNTNSAQSINTNSSTIRLDNNRGGRDRWTLLYGFTGQNVRAFELVAGQNPNSDTKSQSIRATWSRKWGPFTDTDFSVGFDRLHTLIVPEEHAVGPQVTIGGVIDPLGPGSNLPIDRVQNQFRYAARLGRVAAGSRFWTAGFELLRRQVNGSEYSSQRGVITFANDFGRDAMTNFRMGVPIRFSVGIGDPHRGFRNLGMQFYAGGHWSAASHLTLDYGLRYQPVTRPVEVNHLSVVPYGCQCKDLAPRLGFAYRLPGRWGVLRGADGIHFGEILPVTFQQVRFNPPGMIKLEIHNPNLADPLAGADLSPDARSTIFQIPRDLAAPYSHQYNFAWEPAPSSNWKLQLGYVGSRSNRLLYMAYNNRAHPIPGIEQTNGTVNLRRADPRHYDIRRVTNGSRGYFDAGRVSLVVPRKGGFSLDASYWLSKAIDLGGNYTNPASNTDTGQVRSQSEFLVNQDLKGPSSFDASHAFLLRIAYDTPGMAGRRSALRHFLAGWTFSAVVLLKTGTPFDVISGSDGPGFGNVDGSAGDRPNLLDQQVLGRTIGDPDTSTRLLPRSAFAFIQPMEERGNLGHNVFRKGGIRNVNAALLRSWKVLLDKSLDFRAESINFLNTPQFAEPGKELTSPSFGQITNTLNDGRTFRFLVQFVF
jgi:hypothetical protein